MYGFLNGFQQMSDLRGSTERLNDESNGLSQLQSAVPNSGPSSHFHTFAVSMAPSTLDLSADDTNSIYTRLLNSPLSVPSHCTLLMRQSGATENVTVTGIPEARLLDAEVPLFHPQVLMVFNTTKDWIHWIVLEYGFRLEDAHLNSVIRWVIKTYHDRVPLGKFCSDRRGHLLLTYT